MKNTFKIIALIGIIAIFSNCTRDPKFNTASINEHEEATVLYEGRTFEVVLASSEPSNDSYSQPLFCDCVTKEVENQKCIKWERDAGEPGRYCVEEAGDGTFTTKMICQTPCGKVNVYPSIIALSNKEGKTTILSKGLLIPENIDLNSQYRDTQLPDGSWVRTVLVRATRTQQLEEIKDGKGELVLVLLERA